MAIEACPWARRGDDGAASRDDERPDLIGPLATPIRKAGAGTSARGLRVFFELGIAATSEISYDV